MLAHRDQENLVHSHQTAAASKPLNQGLRQLQPKTPGARIPKTPFKVPLKDENDPLTFGKKTIRGNTKQNENTKPAKDAFLTPLEPRTRAPLGMKTTNAKAKGLQTPAQPLGTSKPEKTNKRGSTQKVKKIAPLQENKAEVHQKAPEDDVPDIEYMPPRPKELPDIPDDITYDTTFPQFQPKNMALGLESVYGDNEIGPDGLTKRERKFQEDSIAYDKMVDDTIMKQVESIGFHDSSIGDETEQLRMEEPSKQTIQQSRPKRMVNKQNYASNISTIKSRDAAAALSGTQTSMTRRRPAPIPKPRVSSSLLGPKKTRAPSNPSSMRNTAAAADSKTTVGYSKGRSVSSKLQGKTPASKEPTTKKMLSPDMYMQLYGPPPLGSEMWIRCKAAGCFDEVTNGRQTPEEEETPLYEEDEETQNFQLTL